jgi:3-deoxy-manno-octulosonate cytidylyltransferase (CMP-KDO synthetase)
MIIPEMIDEALHPMIANPEIKIVNLLGKINSEEEFKDRNCIKVVCDLNSDALYFSREPIPTKDRGPSINMVKQVCVIPFRRNFLIEYTNLEPTPLELAESVDMMRVLEHGYKVHMVPTIHDTQAVDTKSDLIRVEAAMKSL